MKNGYTVILVGALALALCAFLYHKQSEFIDNFAIDGFWQLWGTLMMVAAVGLVCVAAGIWLVARPRASEAG